MHLHLKNVYVSVKKATDYVREHSSDKKHNEGSFVSGQEKSETVKVSRRSVTDSPRC